MASAKLLPKSANPKARKPWTVRYWDGTGQHEVSFTTKGEAAARIARISNDARDYSGYVDPSLGREKFSDAATAWLDRKAIAAGTKRGYRSLLTAHINDVIGGRTLASVASDRGTIQDLLTKTMAHLSYSRRKMARLIITGVLDEAVIAGKISSHRLNGIELVNEGSKNDHSDFVFPAHSQLAEMAAGLGSRGLLIWLMRGCGLRVQEAIAVQKSCFRDSGRTLRVYEQAKRDGRGTIALKHRKLGQYRDIPVLGYLWAMVKDLPDGYLFATKGVLPRYNAFWTSYKRLAGIAGIPEGFTPHSLRHAFVSALLGRGVPITDVARWVGHRDINVTYSIYGHLVPNAADRAVSVLDSEYAEWSATA
jgi:integrase